MSNRRRVVFDHVGLNWEEHVDSSDGVLWPAEITASSGDYSLSDWELVWGPCTHFADFVRIMVDADLCRFESHGPLKQVGI